VSRPRPVTVEVGPLTLVATVLSGTWLAHNIEYARVRGAGEWAGASWRSAHAYMGPTGIALLALALLGVIGTLWTTSRLARRLERVRAGAAAGPTSERRRLRLTVDVATLAGLIWAWQLALWVVEENIELHLAGAPAPGLGVLWGAHVLAPFVHLAVAAALAVGIWRLRRPATELARALRAASSGLRALRPRRVVVRPALVIRTWTPVERWGRHLWSRPPPAGRAIP
jgi:hypothetical protein